MTDCTLFESYVEMKPRIAGQSGAVESEKDLEGDMKVDKSTQRPKRSNVLPDLIQCSIEGCNKCKQDGHIIHYHHMYETDENLRLKMKGRMKRSPGQFGYTENRNLLRVQKQELKLCKALCVHHHMDEHKRFWSRSRPINGNAPSVSSIRALARSHTKRIGIQLQPEQIQRNISRTHRELHNLAEKVDYPVRTRAHAFLVCICR